MVWGFVEVEVVPLHLLVTADHNGGLCLGSFERDASGAEHMTGLVFGFLGRDALGSKHCSHLLGVVPAARGQGVGPALKWAQRDHLLAAGCTRATWTYDPLMAGNANLNLHRLGAVCRRYEVDLYGDIRDDLNRGLATDRFEVDWWLEADRVTELAAGDEPGMVTEAQLPPEATSSSGRDDGFRAPLGWADPGTSTFRIEIPADLLALKARDLELARAWRQLTREAFTELFEVGCAATDFVRSGERAFYVMTRSPS